MYVNSVIHIRFSFSCEEKYRENGLTSYFLCVHTQWKDTCYTTSLVCLLSLLQRVQRVPWKVISKKRASFYSSFFMLPVVSVPFQQLNLVGAVRCLMMTMAVVTAFGGCDDELFIIILLLFFSWYSLVVFPWCVCTFDTYFFLKEEHEPGISCYQRDVNIYFFLI